LVSMATWGAMEATPSVAAMVLQKTQGRNGFNPNASGFDHNIPHGCFPGSYFNLEPIMAGRRFVDAEEIEAGADIESDVVEADQWVERTATKGGGQRTSRTNGQVGQVAPKSAL
jgi:hypothetical protein